MSGAKLATAQYPCDLRLKACSWSPKWALQLWHKSWSLSTGPGTPLPPPPASRFPALWPASELTKSTVVTPRLSALPRVPVMRTPHLPGIISGKSEQSAGGGDGLDPTLQGPPQGVWTLGPGPSTGHSLPNWRPAPLMACTMSASPREELALSPSLGPHVQPSSGQPWLTVTQRHRVTGWSDLVTPSPTVPTSKLAADRVAPRRQSWALGEPHVLMGTQGGKGAQSGARASGLGASPALPAPTGSVCAFMASGRTQTPPGVSSQQMERGEGGQA